MTMVIRKLSYSIVNKYSDGLADTISSLRREGDNMTK